ncbi:MAG: hypothetical protein DSY80_06910 [Desulfocapsa sp.]|nr:MAG: hypothetical protein DSY80_06910 [Desulfocapsa sp.]
MAQLSNVMMAFALYIDGLGYYGDGTELKLPAVKFKTEDFQGGGMFSPEPVVLGIEKLEASFKMSSFDPNIISKLKIGAEGLLPFTFRGAVSGANGAFFSLRARMLARLGSWEPDAWKASEKVESEYSLLVSSYTLTHGQREIIHINNKDMEYRVDGQDQLAGMRQAIGIV